MRNLLSSGFIRLKKDKVFWICVVIMFLVGIGVPVSNYFEGKRMNELISLDSGFFVYVSLISIVTSAFSALFVGTEYGEGTMRNKIIAGHKRSAVYLSNLLICLTAGIIMCAAYLIPYMAIGIWLLGTLKTGFAPIIIMMLCAFLMMSAFISLFVIVAMLNQNKSIVSVICVLGAVLILFSGIYISSSLDEPEYFDSYIYTDSLGSVETVAPEKNPNYLSGTKRKVYEFLFDATPGGQVVQLSEMSAENPLLMSVSSLFIILAVSFSGIIFFKKKDLK